MPYFSFSLVDEFSINNFQKCNIDFSQIKPNIKYFSKNTTLWKLLNNKKNFLNLNFIKQEERIKITKIKKNILFCLPPSIGLGDSIEYALSLKAIIDSGKFENLAVAFVGRYRNIFKKYFNINNIYDEVISEKSIKKYDTVFHLTLEINELVYQKYNRQNIEQLITNYFCISKFRNFKKHNIDLINKISIFPISTSPIRTMPVDLLNHIIIRLNEKVNIEIILDKQSEISNYIEKRLYTNSIKILHPINLNQLLKIIENTTFGIFIDSGPLHVAKILNKKGILITSSVGKNILLNDFKSIQSIENDYKSEFCTAPCGLVNIFNYNNKIGCYDSLKILKNKILKYENIKKLQRGNIKNKYINLISNPVNCLKKINKKNIITKIKKNIFN